MTNTISPTVKVLTPGLIKSVALALNVPHPKITWLAGDGSDRCYFRIYTGKHNKLNSKSFVLMKLSDADAQALKNNGYDWVTIAHILEEQNVKVPKIFTILQEHSAIIIEDYGDLMLETKVFELSKTNDLEVIKTIYHKGFEIISRFLEISKIPDLQQSKPLWTQRAFDGERFVWELNFFLQKFVNQVAQVFLDDKEMAIFQSEAATIATILAENSQYFVHRDFHSRNIMVLEDGLAVIDFQDARLGPASYDLVSLIFDSYVPFTASMRRDLLQEAMTFLSVKHPPQIISEIKSLWKPMLLQRQLKAIGSFGYLTVDKQKGDYLKYVAPALKIIEDQGVQDERWPFISSVLMRRIADAVHGGCLEGIPSNNPNVS